MSAFSLPKGLPQQLSRELGTLNEEQVIDYLKDNNSALRVFLLVIKDNPIWTKDHFHFNHRLVRTLSKEDKIYGDSIRAILKIAKSSDSFKMAIENEMKRTPAFASTMIKHQPEMISEVPKMVIEAIAGGNRVLLEQFEAQGLGIRTLTLPEPPYHVATMNLNLEMVKYLISKGIPLESVNIRIPLEKYDKIIRKHRSLFRSRSPGEDSEVKLRRWGKKVEKLEDIIKILVEQGAPVYPEQFANVISGEGREFCRSLERAVRTRKIRLNVPLSEDRKEEYIKAVGRDPSGFLSFVLHMPNAVDWLSTNPIAFEAVTQFLPANTEGDVSAVLDILHETGRLRDDLLHKMLADTLEMKNAHLLRRVLHHHPDLANEALDGWHPLQIAMKNEDFASIYLLLRNGASVSVENYDTGEKLLVFVAKKLNDHALKTNAKSILKLLTSKKFDYQSYDSKDLDMVKHCLLDWSDRDHKAYIRRLIRKGLPLDTIETDAVDPFVSDLQAHDSAVSKKEFLEYLTTKNCANYLGDTYIKGMTDDSGTRLEGNSFLGSILFFRSLIQKVEVDSQIEKNIQFCEIITQKLDELARNSGDDPYWDLQKLSGDVKKKIASMKRGESILLPAGWLSEIGGHAMLCELQCCDDGSFRCTVYNTGDGAERHPFLQGPDKQLIHPLMSFERLSTKDLSEENFLRALFEPLAITSVDGIHIRYSSEDLYEGVFSRFKDKRVKEPKDLSLFITGQRAGSCTMRVLLAYLRKQLGMEAYKKFKFEMDKAVLSNSVLLPKEMLSEDHTLLTIMENGAEKLCRSALKLCEHQFSSHFIETFTLDDLKLVGQSVAASSSSSAAASSSSSSAASSISSGTRDGEQGMRELEEAVHIAEEVLELIREVKPKTAVSGHEYVEMPPTMPTHSGALVESIAALQETVGIHSVPAGASSSSSISFVPKEIPMPPENLDTVEPAVLMNYLTDLYVFCQEYIYSKDPLKHETAFHLIKVTLLLLPVPDAHAPSNIWNHVCAQDCLNMMLKMSKQMMNCTLVDSPANSEKIIAMYKALAIGHRSACRLDREDSEGKEVFLDQFQVSVDNLDRHRKNTLNPTYQSEWNSEIDLLIDYFKSTDADPKRALYNYNIWITKVGYPEEIGLPIPEISGENEYLEQYYRKIPAKEWLSLKTPYDWLSIQTKKTMTQKQWQVAHLWSGKVKGAPNYFHQVRDISFLAQMIGNVIDLRPFDRYGHGRRWFYDPDVSMNLVSVRSMKNQKGESEGRIEIARGVFSMKDGTAYSDPADNRYRYLGHYIDSAFEKLYPKLQGEFGYRMNDTIEDLNSDDKDDYYRGQNYYIINSEKALHPYKGTVEHQNLTARHAKIILGDSINHICDSNVQTFCNLALFGNNRITKEMQKEPEFAKQMLGIVEQRISEVALLMTEMEMEAADLDELHMNQQYEKLLHAYAFLHVLKVRVLDSIRDVFGTKSEIFTDSIEIMVRRTQDSYRAFFDKLQDAPKAIKIEMSIRYMALYAPFPPKEKDEMAALLWHAANVRYLQAKSSDPSMFEKMMTVFVRNSPKFKTYLTEENRGPIFSKISKEILNLPISPEAVWEGIYPEFQTEDRGYHYTINAVTWEVTRNTVPHRPVSVLFHNEDYKFVFGDKKLPLSTPTMLTETVSLYELLDDHGNTIRLIKQGYKDLRIEKIIDGHHYAFVPWKKIPEHLHSLPLPKHPNHLKYQVWQCIDDGDRHVRMIDKETGQTTCLIDPHGILITDLAKSEILKEWINFDEDKDTYFFLHFDNPSFIMALQDVSEETTPKISVDFTRYRHDNNKMVGFERKLVTVEDADGKEIQKQRFQLKNDSQYFLDEDQTLEGLPGFQRYLVVKNAQGKRQVLIPYQTHRTMNGLIGETAPDTYQIISIHLDSHSQLNPTSPEQYVFSAYISLMEKQYLQAFEYLQGSHKLQRYTPEELRLLGWLANSVEEHQDHHPNAIAVRTYASWLARDNIFRNPKSDFVSPSHPIVIHSSYAEPKKWEFYWEGVGKLYEGVVGSTVYQKLGLQYIRYLDIKNAVDSRLRLDIPRTEKGRTLISDFEEFQFIHDILLHNSLPQLKKRLSYIGSRTTSPTRFQLGSSPLKKILKPRLERIEHAYPLGKKEARNIHEAVRILEQISPRLRPGKKLRTHFRDILEIALHGTEVQRKKVIEFVGDMRFDPDLRNQGLRIILEVIATRKDPCYKTIDLVNNILRSDKVQENFVKLQELVQEYHKGKISFDDPEPQLHSVSLTPVSKLPKRAPPASDKLSLAIPSHIKEAWSSVRHLGHGQYTKDVKAISHGALPHYQSESEYGDKRYKELLADFELGMTLNEQTETYTFSPEMNYSELLRVLSTERDQHEQTNEELLENIMGLVNKPPSKEKHAEWVKRKLQLGGHKRAEVSLNDCMGAFLQQSKRGYKELNPALTELEIARLNEYIGIYLYGSIENQQLERKVEVLEQITTQGVEHETQQKLGELLDQKPGYSAQNLPQFLVFEHYMGFRMRKDQVDDIKKMLGITEVSDMPLPIKFQDSFIQKIMGGGKTLVLGTLMSLLKADGYHLSILIPPASLYDTNAQDIMVRAEALFGQNARTILFSRDPEQFKLQNLRHIRQTLVRAIKQRDVVILPPDSLQAMQNRYLDAQNTLSQLYEDPDRMSKLAEISELETQTTELKEILKILKARGVFTFDEVDVVLDVRKELNFPMSTPKRLPIQGVELVAEIFHLAATDKELKAMGLDLCHNRQTLLTDEDYKTIKQMLARKMIDKIALSNIWTNRLFIDDANKAEILEELYGYISNPDTKVPDFLESLHKSGNEEKKQAADLIVLLKQEINEWLKVSWKSSADQHYGFSHIHADKLLAIPYSANNTPSERSEFADPWEMVNRTLQLFLYKGLTLSQTSDYVKKLQVKMRQEWKDASYPPDIRQMPTAKRFFEATGIDLVTVNRSQEDKMTLIKERMRSGEPIATELLLHYVCHEVLSKVKIYNKQISNNAQNLASMPLVRQGYSGTMENKDTFPVVPDLEKGTNGKIIDVLIRQNDTVHVVKDGTVTDFLHDLLDNHPDASKFRAIIDLGPRFKGIDSHDVATDILDYLQSHTNASVREIEGVLYWDDKTNMLCCVKKGGTGSPIVLPATDPATIASITGLSQNQLFTFYPHHKLTGADIPLPDDARAFSTLSEKTTLRDLLQGSMRMRKLFEGQRIETVVSEEILPLIGQVIGRVDLSKEAIAGNPPDPKVLSIAELIPFTEANEADRQKVDIIRSGVQKIHNLVREFVLAKMLKTTDLKIENQDFIQAKHLFIRDQEASLYMQYASTLVENDTGDFLDEKIDAILSPILGRSIHEVITDPKDTDPTLVELCKSVLALKQKLLEKLPGTVVNRAELEWGREATVEQVHEQKSLEEREQQVEFQVEKQALEQSGQRKDPEALEQWSLVHVENQLLTFDIRSCPETSTTNPTVWLLEDVFSKIDHLNPYAKSMRGNILTTKNFASTVKGSLDLFTSYQKAVNEVLVTYNKKAKMGENPWTIMLLANADASFFKQLLEEKSALVKNAVLLESNGEIVQQGQLKIDSFTQEHLSQLQEALVPILFMKGDVRTLNSKQWIDYFRQWVTEERDQKRILFETFILPESGATVQIEYQDSRVETALNPHKKTSVSSTAAFSSSSRASSSSSSGASSSSSGASSSSSKR